ncbi:MAG: HEAT repeat domain-containing protein [Pirellulaceae bacterium]
MAHWKRRNWKGGLAGVAVLSLSSLWVWAQDGDPFGRATTTPGSSPATRPIAPPLRAPGDKEHPVVLAIRETNPSSPDQWLNAARVMVDIREYAEALKYLGQLDGANIDDEQAFALHRQVGTGTLLEFKRIPELQPLGESLARDILERAIRYSRNPVRIDQLIEQLDERSIHRRTEALEELRALDLDGINAVLARAGQASEQERIVLVDTLQAWGSTVDPVLTAALESPSQGVRQIAIETLGRRQSASALIWLLEPLWSSSSDDSERTAAETACARILGHTPSRTESVQRVHRAWQAREQGLGNYATRESMRWNATSGRVERTNLTVHESSVLDRARMAETLAALDPSSDEFQMLAWRGRLAIAQSQVGADGRVDASSLSWLPRTPDSVDRLVRLLEIELRDSRTTSAVAALDLIGQLGEASLLSSPSGEASPVAEALKHSDRRVRLAAARTIIGLGPDRSFPGSNRIVSTLCFFIRSEGEQHVLVGHPVQSDNQTLTGTLASLGVHADAATNGRDLFLKAVANPDLEAILLSEYLNGPESYELVQQLRRDPRTAEIPIGLIVHYEHLDWARRIQRDESRVVAMPWPHGPEIVRMSLDQIAQKAGQRVTAFERRARQADEAMSLLQAAADNPRVYSFEDLHAQQETLVDLTRSPNMTDHAVGLLGIVGTPEAQRALMDVIGDSLYPIEIREAAVDALEAGIARRGLLLTTRELERAYDRRNAAVSEDSSSQQVLDRMLDVLEAPSLSTSGSRP